VAGGLRFRICRSQVAADVGESRDARVASQQALPQKTLKAHNSRGR